MSCADDAIIVYEKGCKNGVFTPQAQLLEESTFKRTSVVVCRIVKFITNDGGKEEDEPRPEGSSLTSNVL